MSLESAKVFLERVAKDRSFARRMEGVESSEVLMDIVKGSGYDFSREELRSAMVSLANLSDADLASVSGGSSAPSDIYMNILSLVEKF